MSPPSDLANRTPDDILLIALEGELGTRQWVRQNLPASLKEADEDHALDGAAKTGIG